MSESNRKNNVTVYAARSDLIRKAMSRDELFIEMNNGVNRHFRGDMLKVNVYVSINDADPLIYLNTRVGLFLHLLREKELRPILMIQMRLSDECYDRWLECPRSRSFHFKVPNGTAFGIRLKDGTQSEKPITARVVHHEVNHGGGRLTHIYIPSDPAAEIPIYPCEPYFEKKADQKSQSQTVSGKAEAEPQSDPEEVDRKATAADPMVERKAERDLLQGYNLLWNTNRVFGKFGGHTTERFVSGGYVGSPNLKSTEVPIVLSSPFIQPLSPDRHVEAACNLIQKLSANGDINRLRMILEAAAMGIAESKARPPTGADFDRSEGS